MSLLQLLLEQLKHSGQINANSTWKSIYPLIESLEPYQNLLGNPGSSPLDLFWDMLDGLEQQAENDQRKIEKIFSEKGKPVDLEMSYDSFVSLLSGDARLDEVDYATVKAVYDRVSSFAQSCMHLELTLRYDSCMAELSRTNDEESRRRSVSKLTIFATLTRSSNRPLTSSLPSKTSVSCSARCIIPLTHLLQNIARIESTSEFLAIEDDDSRRLAFDKFIQRQRVRLSLHIHGETER